jgi:hypothetical protein
MTVDNPSVRLPRLMCTRNQARALMAELVENVDGVHVDLLARASSVCTYPAADEIVHELIVSRGARLHVRGASDGLSAGASPTVSAASRSRSLPLGESLRRPRSVPRMSSAWKRFCKTITSSDDAGSSTAQC